MMKGKICRTSGTVPEMQENLTSVDTQCFPRLAGTTEFYFPVELLVPSIL